MRVNYIDCCDCLEGMKAIPDGSVDMVLCDLPYGTTRNKWDAIIPMGDLWAEYDRICKPNAAVVLFSQMPFTASLAASRPDIFRYEWIWEKNQGTGHLNAKKMPMKIHENVLVFYRTLPTYNPQFGEGKPYKAVYSTHSSNYGKQKDGIVTVNDGKRYPVDVIRVAKGAKDRHLHPTQKPVALCEYLIKTYTNPGEVVLDNCMGSGTTAEACLRAGRQFIGFEIMPEYHAIATQRIAETVAEMAETGQQVKLEDVCAK